jgi:beta-galactosidase/beta-glucuronidase
MNNHIRTTHVQVHHLSRTEADLRITVEPETLTPTTELRGKLVGPRCPGVSTIEVAYPLRPLAPTADSSENSLAARVVIPEPNLWSPQTPFLYEGVVELWQEGQRADMKRLSVGLKL